jgi:hypothetical protein
MSTFRNPVGPQSPTVYWRRRLIVGLGVVAVIVIVILIIVRPGSGSPKAAGTTVPSAAASTPVGTSTSTGAACSDANLTLVPVTDKVSYAAGELPQISMKLTNTGTTSCTVNMGSTKQDLIITSGSETIWNSTDCQTGAVDSPQVLKAGQSVSTPAIPWNRTRSSKSTCSSTTLPQVTAGGASYHLGVTLGDLKAKDTVQFLLN